MANEAQATFICGMPNPWTPSYPYVPQVPVIQEYTYTLPKCDHCFCVELDLHEHDGTGKHLRCCKCEDYMAEKYVKAWMEIWEKLNQKQSS